MQKGTPAPCPAVEFVAAESMERREIELAGYTAHREAGMAIGWEAAAKGLTYSVLIWGWPGTGKSLYARSLFESLNEAGLPYSLLHIHCGKLAFSTTAAELSDYLSSVETMTSSEEVYPLLIALDNAELLGPAGPLEDFHTWLVGFLSTEMDRRPAVVVAATSRPDLVDPKLTNLIRFRAFFQLPNVKTATRLLESNQIPNAEAVATQLYGLAGDLGVVFTGRGLLNAATYARTLGLPSEASPSAIAEAIAVAAAPVNETSFVRYLQQNELALRKSTDFLELWRSRYRRTFEHGRARALSDA